MNKITRLPFALGLLLTGITSVATARSPQPDTVLVQQQKGRLWTAAFQQGWPAAARNQQWTTATEFYTWLDDQATATEEVKQLRKDVRQFVKNTYGHDDATPTELANALETQLLQLLRQKKKPLTATQQEALHQELVSATSSVAQNATISTPPAEDVSTDGKDSSSETTNSAPMKTSATTEPQESRDYLYGLGGLLLGFGAGFLFGRRSSGSGGLESTTSYLAANSSRNADKEEIDWTPRKSRTTALPPADAWSEKPSAKNKSQKQQASAVAPQTEVPEPELPETTSGHAIGSEVQLEVPQLAPMASTHLYGPAPDTPSIEARKLTPQSFPQMPICLRLANPQAAVGTFVLNPHAEQSRLIGNGIRELKAFFDFDLPLPDNFSTITTSKPGKMELRNDTWHLIEKAKIELK